MQLLAPDKKKSPKNSKQVTCKQCMPNVVYRIEWQKTNQIENKNNDAQIRQPNKHIQTLREKKNNFIGM